MKPSLFVAAVLGFVGFVTSFGAHVVAVNLPSYARKVGAGLAVIGVLIAIYDFAEIVAKPLFGSLADHVGMKRTMLAGIVAFVLASLLTLLSTRDYSSLSGFCRASVRPRCRLSRWLLSASTLRRTGGALLASIMPSRALAM